MVGMLQVKRPRCWITACLLAVVALLTPSVLQGQSAQPPSQDHADSSTLQGSVRDSNGVPLPGATVQLEGQGGTRTLTARTDSAGTYRFSAVPEGFYTLRALTPGYRDAVVGSCALGRNEAKKTDFTLELLEPSGKKDSLSETPEFFDEPKFTVAGVTEAMNPGGHGSDTILRTTEALAKDTVSLPPGSSHPASPGVAGEDSLRTAADREPGNFAANSRFGTLLVDTGKAKEALPYLERASQLDPGNYGNSYELALAYADAGQYERARAAARSLLDQEEKANQAKIQERADLLHLLGEVEEKLGNPLEAVREYQRAAELNPSETDLFDWGAELLMHRALEPAVEVFGKGNRLFPGSMRMLAGLGVAWYARGSYDQAAERLCEASDLNPNDPNPYLILGKMQSVGAIQSECLVERLGRFAGLAPQNAMANYYYAFSLRKRGDESTEMRDTKQAASLLERAVKLDPKLGPAYLQLGILYQDEGELSKALFAYQQAAEVSPQLEEAHFRLAQAYGRSGEKSKAQAELQLYEQLSKARAEQVERERREIQQFVYTLRDSASETQPHR